MQRATLAEAVERDHGDVVNGWVADRKSDGKDLQRLLFDLKG